MTSSYLTESPKDDRRRRIAQKKMPIAARVSYTKSKMRSSGSVPTLHTIPAGHSDDKRLRINVSGTHYELWESVVKLQPDTLLASAHFQTYWDSRYDEYFIDRNREMFECVFNFYRTGDLSFPSDLPSEVIMDEVRFYWLENIFNHMDDEEESSPQGDLSERRIFPNNWRGRLDRTRHYLWIVLTEPKYNKIATVYAWCDQLFIFVSILGMIIETLPTVKNKIDENDIFGSIEGTALFYAELCTTCFFTLDVVMRFITTQSPGKLITSVMTWIDIMSVLPFYIQNCLKISKSNISGLRVIRLARVFRMFKLFRRSKKLALIALSLKRSASELLLFVLVWGLGVIIFSVIMYYAEGDRNPKMNSILATCWWAVATMSTVGYGDVYPRTPTGQVVGTVVSFLSMIFLAMPLTIIVSSFSKTYKDSKKGLTNTFPGLIQVQLLFYFLV
ncbi:hypothetical protein ACHWQZ_G007552 [Mnemiopsis leidyi]